MSKYYRRVEIDAEGNSAEPVNFVGVHHFNWGTLPTKLKIDRFAVPDVGFVEAEAYEKEFVEWCLDNDVSKGVIDAIDYKTSYDFIKNGHASYYETLDELHTYWKTEIKDK